MYLALSGTCHEFAIRLNTFGSISDIVLFKVKSECSILLIRLASFGVIYTIIKMCRLRIIILFVCL